MFTNNFNVPVALQVWLASDGYGMSYDDKTFSATELLGHPRQVILNRRANQARTVGDIPAIDITSQYKSRMGHALHDSVENCWLKFLKRDANGNMLPENIALMHSLGINPKEYDDAVINPPLNEVTKLYGDEITVILTEVRSERKIGEFTVSGQFDFAMDGQLQDFKHTATYSYRTELNSDHYTKQGSIYRWLNPTLITSDTTQINFLFNDWKASEINSPDYPPAECASKEYPLLSEFETELLLMDKLKELEAAYNLPEPELPRCTDHDIWKKPDEYAYYAKPDGARASKVFKGENAQAEAQAWLTSKGKGIVKTRVGKVGKCNAKFCSGYHLCTQKDEYLLSGAISL